MENKLHNEKEYYYKDQQFFPKESEKELLQQVNEIHNPYTRTNDIQQQENTGENTSYRRLRDFKEGEFAHSVRSFNSSDYFDFTSKSNKIYNNEEVAFLFQELQNESVEHSFAVVVDKENNFKPLWLTSGNIVSTTVDLHAILFAANAFNAKEIYFIHNHPSGNLTPSNADKSIMKQLKNALKPFNIKATGIIINVTSGKYAVFNEEVDVTNKINLEKNINDYKPEIFNFSKRTFLQSPNVINRIKHNQDAAAFISSIKYSAAEKGGYLLLDRKNNAIGIIFFHKESAEQNSKEAILTAIRYNATALIIYGNNNDFIYSIENKLSSMAKDADIDILDTVVLENPTEIIKEAFVENINKENTPEVLQNFASNKEAVNEGFEKYLKGKIIDKNDAANFISFVHSHSHVIQKKQSMADYFQNEISFSGSKESIQEFNKELIQQGVQINPAVSEDITAYSQKFNNTTDLTVHDLAKELDALYKQSNSEITFQCDSKEGHKIIEFIKSLETNDRAIQAVLNHTDNINNFPIKPDAKNYFSNDFIEANITALEKYEKDLMDFSVNYQIADKKLHESAAELWKYQIDPINIPSINIRETLLAMDEVFQNHNISSNLKNYTMATEKQQPQTSVGEQANIKYLQDQIKYTGFKLSDAQNKGLVDNIQGKKEAFSINVNNKQQEKGGIDAEINYTLNFKKSANGDMQFFNSYDAELIKKDGTKLNHNFSISNTPGAKNITALEAFNLLDGRFVNKDLVNKEGQKANYWVGIDFDSDKKENNNYAFKMFHQNYGYDLKTALNNVGAEPSEQLIKGLEKGNRMPMDIVQNNKIESLFADVNPQMKTFNFYDEAGNKQFIKIDNEVEKSQNNKVDNKPQEAENTSRGRKM